MNYSEAVRSAPPGSDGFQLADLGRCSVGTLALALEPGPAAPPLAEVAEAIGDKPELLAHLAGAVGPQRAGELRRLAAMPAAPQDRLQSARRLLRGLFWSLVYELEPRRWDALAAAEPVHPLLLEALDCKGARVVEAAAGSGRLTLWLAGQASELVAVEPSPPLRKLLGQRLTGRAWVVAGAAQRMPVCSAWADLAISCASFGPDLPLGGDPVLRELERCVRPGGRVALVGPESPQWFERRGYARISFDARRLPTTVEDPELRAFFGPTLDPPHELLVKVV